MLKKLTGLVLVGAIVFSVPVAAFAGNAQGTATALTSKSTKPVKQLLQDKAQTFGISTDGKTNEQIKAELKALSAAKHTEQLNKAAAKLGISTDGKTAEQLKADIKLLFK